MNTNVITFDGYSGTGKGTISIMLAKKIGFHYLDSGALYRTLAYKIVESKIDPKSDLTKFLISIDNFDVSFIYNKDDQIDVFYDGKCLNSFIRDENTAKAASEIAKNNEVRKFLEKYQRLFEKPPGLVADGRDMGSKIFKNADLKFFFVANLKKRAERRYYQLKNQGISANLPDLEDKLSIRDMNDTTRSLSPLVKPEGAIEIDTSDLTITKVFDIVMNEFEKSNIIKNNE